MLLCAFFKKKNVNSHLKKSVLLSSSSLDLGEKKHNSVFSKQGNILPELSNPEC